ncbi:MAG: hypothetical protein E6J37_04555 [Chloroflexi bacterium]|nr:MAG: hypothetical protein E6J37_04555 [Chloroflexota bacterium]
MKVHLMGIGGAGVSALARILAARGDEVSGCDTKSSDTTAELEDAGIRVELGHDPEHVLFQDLLVYSGAVKSSPELDAARAMGVKVLSRAEMLAELIAERDSIAVGGSAGKTTVTYMIGHILTEAGFDPTVLVGDGSSSRAGRSQWLVAEVDESDGSLVLRNARSSPTSSSTTPTISRTSQRFAICSPRSSPGFRPTGSRCSAPTTSVPAPWNRRRGASRMASASTRTTGAERAVLSPSTTRAASSVASTSVSRGGTTC